MMRSVMRTSSGRQQCGAVLYTRSGDRRFREELERGILLLEVLHFPLVREQQHAAVLPIDRGGRRPAEQRQRLRWIRDPPRGGERGRIDGDLDAVLRREAALDDVELQRADDADDRLAAAA